MGKKINIRLARGNLQMHCRNIYPLFFNTKEIMDLPPEHRLLFLGLMCLSDTEGRVILDCGEFLRRFAYRDFSDENAVRTAVELLAENGLIIIYDYEEEGYRIQLVQIVNYDQYQAGKSYIYGSSYFPAPEGYIVNPPSNTTTRDERFLNFFNSYPNKAKKIAASRAWIRLEPDDTMCTNIMDGLKKWNTYWRLVPTAIVPTPDLFLAAKIYSCDPPVRIEKTNINIEYDENTLPF